MNKSQQKIETIIAILTAIIMGIISILNMLGLSVFNIPSITLLLLSALSAYVVGVLTRRISYLEKNLTTTDLDALLGLIRKQVPENLEITCGEYIDDMSTALKKAIREEIIEFHDVEEFRFFYKKTLKKFSNSMFYSTSIPYKKYFWRNKSMEDAVGHFISSGGSMKKLFFLNNLSELQNSEVLNVLESQKKLGVEVYAIEKEKVPIHLLKFFLVDKEKNIAWEVFTGPTNEIIKILAIADKNKIEKYIRIAEQLWELDSIHKI